MIRDLISIQNLSVKFMLPSGEDLVALRDITLGIHEGEFLTIVGPSGCGKTTLINVVAGLVWPSEGQVTLDGVAITGPGPDRAMVFQEYALLPWRTVEENVRFGIEALPGITDEEKRISDALKLVGLDDFRSVYPRQLSGGMQQRVGIARALVARPRILLMDEPFGALDAMGRDVMRSELEEIAAETRQTVMFVTHSIDEAIQLGDRIVVMTARPGEMKEIIEVGLPRPRYDAEVRSEHGFGDLREHIWQLLREQAEEATR